MERIITEIGLHKTIPINELKIGSLKLQLSQWLSILVVSMLSISLPKVLIIILLKVPRVTKSEKNHKLMQTVFVFIFFSSFILPSVGINS